MIWKLSLTGIKKRFKDYLVLFSGLIVSSMIFYMFLSIATNPAFLAHDVKVETSIVKFIFAFGIILLVLVTLLYLIYANSFLLSMREHDYGMFMMLGAKGKRVGLIVFLETFFTGILATGIGILLSFGLTSVISNLLISKLKLAILHFQVILPSAILGTIGFFIAVFLFCSLRNVHKLIRTPLIRLLTENQQPVKLKRQPLIRLIETILGIILLAVGYHVMSLPSRQVHIIISTGFVTIVSGSYFIFAGFFNLIITFLSRKKNFAYHGLRIFTLGQLKFRLYEYTRILTLISLLFALALGAITVGLNFDTVKEVAKQSTYYDSVVVSGKPEVKKEVAKLNIQAKQTYNYKETKRYLYFKQTQFKDNPLKELKFYLKNEQPLYKVQKLPTHELAHSGTAANNNLKDMLINGSEKKIRLVSQTKWQRLQGKRRFITLLNVKDFDYDYPILLRIQKLQLHENPKYSAIYDRSKPNNYQLLINLASGFEFMGFFLGIAFLTMLASTLMFKVLNEANRDKARYQMLNKIGIRKQILKQSINYEIGTLFLLPASLGIIDVLFGLQLFRSLLPDPYHNIWLPFIIFGILYLLYYLLTVKLYKKVVLDYK
ncbi:ABC transporter permease [Lactobacillus sp. ESL0236]|uniref:FtsX-like permease family protein n=1 Tax=unclassified Lactobacillus TaxID=2620435 RepID=UPI000EFA84B3|nr:MULTISPECIES: ABC transporter permease [unclassified Lactobacillus]RMC42004.1 ABC transporter permease [Lactobacillus sp. ESL0237]RMC45611.1 ABC transporter permease [Lactobacillus sp. ESL0234]RMC46998.1 ABC transporter permease [Lactobacillus sp. ESL0236]